MGGTPHTSPPTLPSLFTVSWPSSLGCCLTWGPSWETGWLAWSWVLLCWRSVCHCWRPGWQWLSLQSWGRRPGRVRYYSVSQQTNTSQTTHHALSLPRPRTTINAHHPLPCPASRWARIITPLQTSLPLTCWKCLVYSDLIPGDESPEQTGFSTVVLLW